LPCIHAAQIKYETFLEDVNNILTSGEVPNLFPKDELSGILDELRPAAKAAGAGETQEQLAAFFLERVRCAMMVCLSQYSPFLHEASGITVPAQTCSCYMFSYRSSLKDQPTGHTMGWIAPWPLRSPSHKSELDQMSAGSICSWELSG